MQVNGRQDNHPRDSRGGDARVLEEQGKYVAPPGTMELLKTYVRYAPYGYHGGAVWSMIQKINPEEGSAKPVTK